MWVHLLIGTGVLSAIVLLWFGVYMWLNPRLPDPDGEASVTGSCGDTMELRLKFRANRVSETSHWTNGCVFSLNCIVAAADLAKDKTPEELLDLMPETIGDAIGGLPTDHMHCATLAVAALKEAVNDYMKKIARDRL
jgi:NifU-like protein involved in Fe-S cluster formation